MSRHPFGWSLPPGVTQRHIDEAAGGYDEPPAPCPICGDPDCRDPHEQGEEPMEHTRDALTRTDWRMLAQQKLELLKVITKRDLDSGGAVDPLVGLLIWLDALQGAASRDGFPVVWTDE